MNNKTLKRIASAEAKVLRATQLANTIKLTLADGGSYSMWRAALTELDRATEQLTQLKATQ